MTYIAADDSTDGVAQVIYESKDGKAAKTFDALDWLAQLVTHIPTKGEQMVRYYGFYSNKSRGLRKKAGTDNQVPTLIRIRLQRFATLPVLVSPWGPPLCLTRGIIPVYETKLLSGFCS